VGFPPHFLEFPTLFLPCPVRGAQRSSRGCEPSCRRSECSRSLDALARNSSLPSRSDTLITRTSSMASFSSSDMCIKASWRRVLFQGSVASKWSSKRFLRVVFIQSSTCSSVIGFPGPGDDVDMMVLPWSIRSVRREQALRKHMYDNTTTFL